MLGIDDADRPVCKPVLRRNLIDTFASLEFTTQNGQKAPTRDAEVSVSTSQVGFGQIGMPTKTGRVSPTSPSSVEPVSWSPRPYSRADARRVAACLTDALSADPLFIATFGMAPWPGFFKWMNWKLFESFGMADVVANSATGEIASAAIWMEPRMTFGASLRGLFMMLYLVCCVGFRRMFRLAKVMGIVESKRRKYAPTALHLQTMGTSSAQQGKGIGSDVLKAGIARADARGVPCFLESFNPRNVPFFERLGFRVVEQVYPFENGTVGDGSVGVGKGPVCTLMLRPFEKAEQPFVPEEEEEGAEAYAGGSKLTQGDGLMMAKARRSPGRPRTQAFADHHHHDPFVPQEEEEEGALKKPALAEV